MLDRAGRRRRREKLIMRDQMDGLVSLALVAAFASLRAKLPAASHYDSFLSLYDLGEEELHA